MDGAHIMRGDSGGGGDTECISGIKMMFGWTAEALFLQRSTV